MDPYLERYWGDVHQKLITYSSDALNDVLPPHLCARTEERVYLQDEGDDANGWHRMPDTFVTRRRWSSEDESEGGVAVLDAKEKVPLATPFIYPDKDPVTEGFIEIRERNGGKVITIIEFLSPTNKLNGNGRTEYDAKRTEILRSETSLVEIDLLRGGPRNLAIAPERIPSARRDDYIVCVTPGWGARNKEVYTLPLRERLLGIPIPLRKREARAPLDLQSLIDQAYQRGRYDDIDYSQPCDPPLTGDEAAWAARMVAEHLGRLSQ